MEKKLIAVTFDDGPNTVTTPRVLDVLEKHGAAATFFLVGDNINADSKEVVRRAYDMGNEIANHSRTHSVMSEMSDGDIAAEIQFTSEQIKKITGRLPGFFRPPYIAVSENMFDAVGLPFIAGFGCTDWEDSVSAEERFKKSMEQAVHGGMILLHDMSGNDKTVAALDMLIPALRERGFELVTVSELFRLCSVRPHKGIVYSTVFDSPAP